MPTRDSPDLAVETLFLLRAARETGALEALLSSAGTPDAVADEADVTERAARVLVETLAEEGFLERVGDEYEPTNRALGLMATRDPRSIGRVPHALDRLDRLAALPETMRSGRAPDRTDAERRHEVGAEAAADDATVRACVTAALRATPDAETALSVPGGAGTYASELAARGLETTLLDAAAVIDRVGPMLRHRGIECLAGSLADLDSEYDLVLAVDALWRASEAENRHLVQAAADRLAPGGTLALVEPLRHRSSESVPTTVRALATGPGACYDEATVVGWCADAGLDPWVEDVPGTPFQAVLAARE